ncbi:AP-3 complex subunit beta [Yamadazyma tenuis]|nr:AP-3 complex subunit beta [Yamadazyma tenuis]
MAESLSKISSIFESAKDIAIEAAVSASSRLADTPTSSRPQEIRKLLSSRVERDVLNGMKCVISLVSRGEDGLPYFAEIVKNITSSNSKVRNLVLVYLTRYAEVEPDKALLSINSIQKLLDDKSPATRANSVKSLSGIRIPSIIPILLVCLKRTINDRSPLVRASTAIAIAKVYEIDKTSSKQLFEYITKLLADSDAQVVGTAIKAYVKMTSRGDSHTKKWAPIHGHFRRFCEILPEFDEWAQSTFIDLLTDYSRMFLAKPKLYIQDSQNTIIDLPEDFSAIANYDYDISFDEDMGLFLKSLRNLVYSDSEFVILSILRALLALAPPKTIKEFDLGSTLCAMISDSDNPQVKLLALQTISVMISKDKTVFAPHYKKFYIFTSDTIEVAKLKLGILSLLVDESNIKYVIEELKYNALNNSDSLVTSEAMRAIGRCSGVSDTWNDKILKWCLKNIRNASGSALNELLTVIRYMIQIQQQLKSVGDSSNKKIASIVYNLSLILYDEGLNLESDAKASIIWIIGEFTKECDNQIAPDVLRRFLEGFADEPEEVRYQLLVLSAKLFSLKLDEIHEIGSSSSEFLQNDIISKMFQRVLTLCKYDSSYDTRDKSRMFNILLNSGHDNSQLASLFLQVPKPAPIFTSLVSNSIESKVLVKYLKTSAWADQSELPPASIRKPAPVVENKLNGSTGVSSSMISKKIGELPTSTTGISSSSYNNLTTKIPKPTYQLQSLDEFFGSEEEEGDSSDEEYSEESSEEDFSEEESAASANPNSSDVGSLHHSNDSESDADDNSSGNGDDAKSLLA